MSWLLRFSAVAALSFVALAGQSQTARADFRVCNGTQNLVGVAIGYRASDGWVTEGWWQIPATSCATLIEGQLQSRYYYLYAEDAARGGRWAGEINMCVADDEFKIVGVQDCVARGYQRMEFKEYDTGRQGSWMVQLSDVPGAVQEIPDEPDGAANPARDRPSAGNDETNGAQDGDASPSDDADTTANDEEGSQE